jgi:hypothetical protein
MNGTIPGFGRFQPSLIESKNCLNARIPSCQLARNSLFQGTLERFEKFGTLLQTIQLSIPQQRM